MAECVAGCLITIPSTDFDFAGCGILDAIRSGYIKNFIGMRCDETVPDLTDDTAIAAQVAAGTIFVSPVITGELPFPSLSDPITENCQPEQNLKKTYSFNFDSYRTDVTGLTDFASWEKVEGALSSWYIAPVTCDNIVIIPQDFATTGLLGFEMRGTISPVFANTSAMSYRGELTFNYNQVLNGGILTSAVITALGLSGTAVT